MSNCVLGSLLRAQPSLVLIANTAPICFMRRTFSSRTNVSSNTSRSKGKAAYVPNTTVEALKEAVKTGRDEALSNRQLFARLHPEQKTIDMLDMYRLGIEKQGKYDRKRWFHYREPEVKLPHLSFFAGAQQTQSFPSETLPEIAFVGRSNVGKSTLVNQLCGSTAARTSNKPGLTQQLNFYTANNDFHLIDMPGYGFAFAKEEAKNSWLSVIESYIHNRRTLQRVMVLLDARHGIKVNDRDLLEVLERTNTKYQFVLTKCDLVYRTHLAKLHLLVSNEASQSRHCVDRVMLVSARDKAGLNSLRKEIVHICNIGEKYLTKEYYKNEHIAGTEYSKQLQLYHDTARSKGGKHQPASKGHKKQSCTL
ncbi:hypothetical protein GGI25_002599 [Coemansia spiralis]|uniref:EngB-type G domain-containing protein n=2 Tax=Coemansia TaxID=4863 RepID=A0A9W8KYB1_9FUNG|nr:P-loop containing nucleoside triphosphate hydrolase protein [Coemansia spiralis]KAJ1992244.1 hypothetical protein EDC05_002912 [Coemansia umbellata]KAJ2623358.1 hypothetical protein GGI26_002396 [Coemansia sp. RSA 1358]KAJ2678095.1 hypothetical protein GGI25_002599 [Coemansia spiralis]